MNKSSINPLPKFFDRYINLVEQENLIDGLNKTLEELESLDWESLTAIGSQVYTPNKWTINEVFQHLIDNERIQSTRALRIGRGESLTHDGYDENRLAETSFANSRTLEEIIDEFIHLRKSTIHLFKSLGENQIQQRGNCSGIDITVLALGFQIAGHQIHHQNVIKERYYPLIA
jgi:hypothetical protein